MYNIIIIQSDVFKTTETVQSNRLPITKYNLHDSRFI